MNYKLGPRNDDMLNVRGDSVPEFDEHVKQLKNSIAGILELGELLRGGTGQAILALQQAGLQPQIVGPTPPAPAVAPQGYSAPPPPPPPAAPVAASQCPACNRSTACQDCGGATTHGVKSSARKATSYNAHMCAANERHKVTWCTTPLPAAFQAVFNHPGLIYG